jgi:hypothetical protein
MIDCAQVKRLSRAYRCPLAEGGYRKAHEKQVWLESIHSIILRECFARGSMLRKRGAETFVILDKRLTYNVMTLYARSEE